MEILYRIFTWLILAAAYFFLVPIFWFGAYRLGLYIPRWLIGLIVFAGLMISGWRSMIRKDVKTDPPEKSRIQSILVWLGIMTIIFAIIRFQTRKTGFFLYCCGISTDYLLSLLLTLIAVLCIIFRPFNRHKLGLLFGIAGIAAGFLLWELGMLFEECDYRYQGGHLPIGYIMPHNMRKRFSPKAHGISRSKASPVFYIVMSDGAARSRKRISSGSCGKTAIKLYLTVSMSTKIKMSVRLLTMIPTNGRNRIIFIATSIRTAAV